MKSGRNIQNWEKNLKDKEVSKNKKKFCKTKSKSTI